MVDASDGIGGAKFFETKILRLTTLQWKVDR